MERTLIEWSGLLAMVLRHKPHAVGIELDAYGWADVRAIVTAFSKMGVFTLAMLKEIVRDDEKKRYSFNEDGTKIRANQGHSVKVDVELTKAVPPAVLYHGTGIKYVESIDKEGLLPRQRLYVHLSSDVLAALKVGKRHGKPFVYEVLSGEMTRAGYKFYLSANGVWLTKFVPPDFLKDNSEVANNEV